MATNGIALLAIMKSIEEGAKIGQSVTKEMSKLFDELAQMSIWRGNNSFTKGFLTKGDKLIFSEEFRHAERARIGDVKIYEVNFDKNSTPVDFEKITAIIYEDYWVDATGANGEILDGGINQKFLKFRITPEYCMYIYPRGCHSKLLIYGK